MQRCNILPVDSLGNSQGFRQPVDLQIPFSQPGHSQDYLSLSQIQYHESDVLFSGFEKNIDLGLPFYVSLGIGGSIHIVSLYWSLELQEGEFSERDEFLIDEVSSGATIDNGSGFDDLVAHRKSDGDMNSSFIGQGYKYMAHFMGVTISFLSHVFFLISIVQRPYFSFAPSYRETDRYLLAFPSYSFPLVLPLQYCLVLQDCLTPQLPLSW